MNKADSIKESYARYYEYKQSKKNEMEIEEMTDEMKKIDDLNKTIDGLNAEIDHMDAEIVRLKAENAAMRQILHEQVNARIERLAQVRKDFEEHGTEGYIPSTDDLLSGRWSF
jgi:predicted nuclease with TOPRIM domain